MKGNEVVVINYRDPETGLPFMNDNAFAAGLENLVDEDGTGIQREAFGSEGQYGPVHDWKADPKGSEIAVAANPGGRSDLQSWLDDRRAAFDALVETYSGDELARHPYPGQSTLMAWTPRVSSSCASVRQHLPVPAGFFSKAVSARIAREYGAEPRGVEELHVLALPKELKHIRSRSSAWSRPGSERTWRP